MPVIISYCSSNCIILLSAEVIEHTGADSRNLDRTGVTVTTYRIVLLLTNKQGRYMDRLVIIVTECIKEDSVQCDRHRNSYIRALRGRQTETLEPRRRNDETGDQDRMLDS